VRFCSSFSVGVLDMDRPDRWVIITKREATSKALLLSYLNDSIFNNWA
jgi:hypothetical protein